MLVDNGNCHQDVPVVFIITLHQIHRRLTVLIHPYNFKFGLFPVVGIVAGIVGWGGLFGCVGVVLKFHCNHLVIAYALASRTETLVADKLDGVDGLLGASLVFAAKRDADTGRR